MPQMSPFFFFFVNFFRKLERPFFLKNVSKMSIESDSREFPEREKRKELEIVQIVPQLNHDFESLNQNCE